MKRLAPLLAGVLVAACAELVLGPATQTDRAGMFDEVWHQFDLHYSFFLYKHVNWDSVGAEYRARATAATTDAEFAKQVGAMLRELKDVHASLTPGGEGSTIGYVSPFDTTPTFFSAAAVAARYVAGARPTSGHHMMYGLPAPGVGYVRIGSFAGSDWAGEMDEVLDSLKGIASLIVDVRNNHGGNSGLAIDVAGRFSEKARTYGWVRTRNGPNHGDFTDYVEETVKPTGSTRFRGDVYLLTNRRDFSSAEDFVLALRVIPRVTVIGDTTAGASGGPIARELPNGWSYELSSWIEYTPARNVFEGIGLAPDIVVKGTAHDAANGTDPALARALTLATGITFP